MSNIVHDGEYVMVGSTYCPIYGYVKGHKTLDNGETIYFVGEKNSDFIIECKAKDIRRPTRNSYGWLVPEKIT